MPLAATRVYQMSFFTGFGVSAIIYFVLNRLFPVPGTSNVWEEVNVSDFDRSSVSDVDHKSKDDAGVPDLDYGV